jgi:hypothetical protein
MAFTRNGKCEYCLKNCTTTVITSRFEYYASANHSRYKMFSTCKKSPKSRCICANATAYLALDCSNTMPFLTLRLRLAAIMLRAQGGTKAAPRREGETRDMFSPKDSLAECRQFLKTAASNPAPLLKVLLCAFPPPACIARRRRRRGPAVRRSGAARCPAEVITVDPQGVRREG